MVEAFYRALADRDGGTLATYLNDDVVWTISGPVDILPFCGQRVGKDGMMKLLMQGTQCSLMAITPLCLQD